MTSKQLADTVDLLALEVRALKVRVAELEGVCVRPCAKRLAAAAAVKTPPVKAPAAKRKPNA
jgi:hypothetical protein